MKFLCVSKNKNEIYFLNEILNEEFLIKIKINYKKNEKIKNKKYFDKN